MRHDGVDLQFYWEEPEMYYDVKMGLEVNVTGANVVDIQIGNDLKMVLSRHNGHREKFGRSFLGFYIVKDQALSSQAHGLIGIFITCLSEKNNSSIDFST